MKMDIIRKISDFLIKNKEEKKSGLLDGNMGICLFLYHSYKVTNDLKYKKEAEKLLDEVYKHLEPTALTFESGLSGIGWGIEYLINKGFCKGDSNHILREIDSCIFRFHQQKEKITMNLTTGYGGYLLYQISRLRNEKNNSIIAKEMTAINKDLFRQFIDRINTEAGNGFSFLNKDVYVDLFNAFPHIILVLKKALVLNIYNEKIHYILRQWAFNMEVNMPRINIHRILLATTLKNIDNILDKPLFDKVINNLLFSIDYKILSTEFNPYSFSLIDGWHGFIFVLKQASEIFNENIPNYKMLNTIRYEIIEKHKNLFENYMDRLLDPSEEMIVPNLNIKNGLAGVGLLYILHPEVLN